MWLLLPLALLLVPAPARAQPVCDAARLGTLACQAGRMCECRHERGGSLTGRMEGFRWDCGILRPNCPPFQLQAPLSPPMSSWPPGLPMPQLWLEREAPGRPRASPPPGNPMR